MAAASTPLSASQSAPQIDIESLRALQAVVATGGFTAAAEQLGMSQSSVSHKIRRLEERVGLDLVVRAPTVTPTADGADLLRFADRIVSAHDEAVAHLTRSELEGDLRLASNEDLHSDELVEVLARFGRAYPNVRIDVRVELSGVIAEWIDAGEVDLGLLQIPAAGPDGPRPTDVIVRAEHIAWVAAPGAQFPSDAPLPFLSFGAGWAYRDDVVGALEAAGHQVRSALTCPSVAGVQSAVEAGLGVAAINARNFTTGMARWGPGDDIALPEVVSVLRAATEEPAEALAALRRAVHAQFQMHAQFQTPGLRGAAR